MKKTLISTAVATALSLGAVSAQALTVTLLDNTNPTSPFPAIDPLNSAAFVAGNEFRVASGGNFAGFGEKSITGDQVMTWDFSMAGNSGTMTAVAGTDIVPAASTQPPVGGGHTASGPGLFQNATFFGGGFGFLAPLGNAADNGPATINFDSTDNFTMTFPIMEAHWNGAIQMLGVVEGGITFSCTGALGGTGNCTADSLIDPSEDSAGFAGQYTQWDFAVSVDPAHVGAVPVPAAVWLFGSGLIGLVGVARRKKTAN